MNKVVIVGGGLAGAAAAIRLAKAGCAVTLIEKELTAHDKVLPASFSVPEAMRYLAILGIDLAAMGAVPITRVGFEGIERALPFAASSLSRRVLDEALLAKAQAFGASVLRGRKVQGIEQGCAKTG